MNPVEEIIKKAFPDSLISLRTFDDWCALICEEVQPAAMNVVAELETWLERAQEGVKSRESVPRDYWLLFGNETPIKSISSIRSKLARGLIENENSVSLGRLTSEQLQERVLAFSDLGRCRIVCTFNSDAECLLEQLIQKRIFLRRYECPGGVKDFIYNPDKRHGLKGHRARQFSARIPLDDDRTFGFEVQLMTVLQHAWDRRNHPFYEFTREGRSLSTELLVNDFSCSETLHLVDRQADMNWRTFLQEIKKDEK